MSVGSESDEIGARGGVSGSGSGDRAAVDAFVGALRAMDEVLASVPGKLEGARVHDHAFGKLFEATEVRDAYHQRLPETEKDVAEAREVIAHFVTGLSGGHAIGARVAVPTAAASPPLVIVPQQATGGVAS